MPTRNQGDFWNYFFELYEAIPRQGPGDRESTERALRMLPALTSSQRLLDIGCGAGAQTLDLARASEAQIVAVDRHEAFVTQLMSRATEQGLRQRILAQIGDINEMRFYDGSFDAIWCEGAIVIVAGFAKGLSSWRRWLVPGGHLVVSELCWLHADPPSEVKSFFDAEGASVTDIDTRRQVIVDNGYRLVGDFVLPPVGWWENYYVHLEAALQRFCVRHAGNNEALKVAARSQFEIDLYRKYHADFGYAFFVMQRR